MSEYNDNTEDTREVEAMRKMFVGGLNRDTSDEVFFDYFSQFGNMVDKVVIKDPVTKLSRGFGFITYDMSDAVENVFKARPHVLGEKTLDVKRAMPRDSNSSTAHAKVLKLFIGGIGQDLTPDLLQEYIEGRHATSIGTVSKIDFIKDKDSGFNKGFGFLECSDHDFADRLTISETQFFIKGKKMSLKKATPKPGEGGQQEGGRGGFRGGRGGSGGRGRGGPRGGGRGGFNRNEQGGYGSGGGGYNNYNQGGGYQQQQNGGSYGGAYQSGGGYNQSQGGGYQQGYQQQAYGQYNQNQGYQQGYGQNSNQGGYAAGNQGSYGGNTGGNNRHAPY